MDILGNTEKATYDPDLPHDFLRPLGEEKECGLCGRSRKDELHKVELSRQHASTGLLARELGT